jgi:prophage regulatory protein
MPRSGSGDGDSGRVESNKPSVKRARSTRFPLEASSPGMGTTTMQSEMFARPKMDPGRRTLGELLQERQWAVAEIERLRATSGAPAADPRRPGKPINVAGGAVSAPVTAELAAPSSQYRMLRMPEVSNMVGLSRACIYRMITDGQFPAGVHIGGRARRLRMAEVVAWLERLGE